MISEGNILRTHCGHDILTGKLISAGAQGCAHWATDLCTGDNGVVKVFHSQYANKETIDRLSFLQNQQLDRACRALFPPKQILAANDLVGYFAFRAPGQDLESSLAQPDWDFREGLLLAAAVAQTVSVLHDRGIAHGDIRAANMNVHRSGGTLDLGVYDFDNYSAPQVPPPPMIGDFLYMAPELRISMTGGSPTIPNVETDRFSLGVVIYEVTMLRHIADGADQDQTSFDRAMCSGLWAHDPASPSCVTPTGGYPTGVLNSDMSRLFRHAFSLDPDERPSAARWDRELMALSDSIQTCPVCRNYNMIDASKTACVFCNRPFPVLALATRHGQTIRVEKAAIQVGRMTLHGSPHVSSLHAIFRRVGAQTWMEPLGQNGTYRWSGASWMRLPDGQPVFVSGGDRLKFADLEVDVVTA